MDNGNKGFLANFDELFIQEKQGMMGDEWRMAGTNRKKKTKYSLPVSECSIAALSEYSTAYL